MAQQQATLSPYPPAQGPAPAVAKATAGLPYLKLTITASDGAGEERPVLQPIVIAFQRELSLKLAAMHALEYIGREIRKLGLKDALKGIGLK